MNDVAVRFFDLDAISIDETLLSKTERERVARKATPILRQRQAAAYHSLRTTLGELLDMAPRALVFHIADSGKPQLIGAGLHFNLSHSDGVGMLAWGPRQIGADVEALIARPSERLAEHILAPRELSAWRLLPPVHRQTELTRAWTRKEAVLKATGRGLRTPPRSVEVCHMPALPPLRVGYDGGEASAGAWCVDLDGQRWQGVDWSSGVPDGYRAAVCMRGTGGTGRAADQQRRDA